MKVLSKSILFSLVIHMIYFVGMMLVGYFKTKFYTPDIFKAWNDVHTLQSKAAFGFVYSPWIFLVSFIGIAIFSGVIIITYKKNIR
jgi:hypothetical protein